MYLDISFHLMLSFKTKNAQRQPGPKKCLFGHFRVENLMAPGFFLLPLPCLSMSLQVLFMSFPCCSLPVHLQDTLKRRGSQESQLHGNLFHTQVLTPRPLQRKNDEMRIQ